LALTVQLDSFEQVKKAMDTFVADLREQQAEEVEFKEYCVKELNDNEKERYDRATTKKELENELERLDARMNTLKNEIDADNDQIKETQTDVKKASQNREIENGEFQTTIKDQRAIQGILRTALQRLRDFYATRLTGEGAASDQLVPLKREVAENAPGNVLIQQNRQTPPTHFNELKSNAGASPVMSLIEQIIGDSTTLEAESVAAERKAQTDYEKLVKDSNDLISQLKKSVVEKTEASANAKEESGAGKSNLVSTVSEMESLAQFEGDLHSQCDFVLKNFDVRQKARLQEIAAVQQAKAIVSGDVSR
jgi:peptidoglycan hydrolase CwlO-like protein